MRGEGEVAPSKRERHACFGINSKNYSYRVSLINYISNHALATTMITTVLVDYDGTLHDWDGVLVRSLDGVLGLSGRRFYEIWTYDIHRSIVHRRHINRHDDLQFHCQLLYKHLDVPYDEEITATILAIFQEASEKARNDPIYFADAVPALDRLREAGLVLCLSTGRNAEDKAVTLEKTTGTSHFSHVFSEPGLGYLKTAPEYYRIVLKRMGVGAEETVSVGDTPLSDIRPANLTGITTIWLNRDGEPKPIDPDTIPDYEVSDLTQAADIILR